MKMSKKKLDKQSSVNTIIALNFSSLLLFLLSFLCICTHQANANIFVYGGCSDSKFEPNSPFDANLKSLLSSIITSSSQSSYNSFAVGNDSGAPANTAIYGLYQCRGDLSLPDCGNCMQNAVGQLGIMCTLAYGARIQLESCYVRYENGNFLGMLDIALIYKKCSPKTSHDAEFFKRRDDILADLQTGAGFKVSSLGLIQGFSQCLGDLSSGDCSSCLSEAVGKLTIVCGSALAADVYLGKCYARYWASGYYNSPTDSLGDGEAGRTVAIIVGVLAGLAVIIVLLTFLRKSCE